MAFINCKILSVSINARMEHFRLKIDVRAVLKVANYVMENNVRHAQMDLNPSLWVQVYRH